mgnify:CR=1 FL=1
MITDEKVDHIVEKTLSISIAAYNVEKFLKNTLDSLVAPEIIDDIEVLKYKISLLSGVYMEYDTKLKQYNWS